MKIAPSTPTLSIAATISSPVTWGGQLGTPCQGASACSLRMRGPASRDGLVEFTRVHRAREDGFAARA